jgi:hypothetical protein
MEWIDMTSQKQRGDDIVAIFRRKYWYCFYRKFSTL